jgi:hypothetical protein
MVDIPLKNSRHSTVELYSRWRDDHYTVYRKTLMSFPSFGAYLESPHFWYIKFHAKKRLNKRHSRG